MHSSIADSTPLPRKSVLMISGDLLPWTQTCQPQKVLCTFAVHLCTCLAITMSFLSYCHANLNTAMVNSLGWTASLPPVTKRRPFPYPLQAEHMDIALPPVPLPSPSSRSQFLQPCPSLLGKGTQFFTWLAQASHPLDSCNPVATERCLLLPSISPVGHTPISVRGHVSKLTTPSHTSRAFLGFRAGRGLLPLFGCL